MHCIGYAKKMVFASVLLVTAQGQAQTAGSLKSPTDTLITINRISVLPITDNIDGIYARPVQEKLVELLRNQHRWTYVDSNLAGLNQSVNELEQNPTAVQKIAENVSIDAFISGNVIRGPNGTRTRLALFLRGDGLLLLEEVIEAAAKLDIVDLQRKVSDALAIMLSRLPYRGLVLSRQGLRVTINMGHRDGLKTGDQVTAILVTSLKRHPRYNFLVQADREVLGKIIIEKSDETLSFGRIVSERSRDVILVGTKLMNSDQVEYANTSVALQSKGELLSQQNPSDSQQPIPEGEAWAPLAPPTFGKVGIRAGLGSYRYNSDPSGVGGLTAQAPIYPALGLLGELWLTPKWTILAEVKQGVASIKNPRSGSSPSDINLSTTRLLLSAGYNFLLNDEFFGPKIQLSAGLLRYNTQLDSTSPLALTSTSYSGLQIGILGSLPIDDARLWEVGGGLYLFLFPQTQESPQSSGSSVTPTINSFRVFASRKLTERIRVAGSLDFDTYRSTFSGQGTRGSESASSSSQQSIMLFGGIDCLF